MSKELIEKISIEKDKRIIIYKVWSSPEWIYYVETQSLINHYPLPFMKKWRASCWNESGGMLVKIKGYYSLDEAKKYNEALRENYLNG